MADDLEKKKKLITEIEALYKKLGQHNPFGALNPATDDMRFLLDLLRDVKEEVHSLDGGVNEMADSWRAILDEVKANNTSINASKRSLSSLTDVANKLKDHYKGINTLSVDELEKLKQRSEIEKSSLSDLQRSLQAQINSGDLEGAKLQQAITLQNTINGLLSEQDSVLQHTQQTLDETIERHKKINHELGFYPKALAGADRLLKRMGLPDLGISDALKKTHALGQAAHVAGTEFSAMGTFLSQVKTNIAGVFSKANLIQGALTVMAKVLSDVDKGAGEYAKSMNVTYSEALNVRGEMQSIASLSDDASLNSARLQTTLMAVGKEMGSNAKLNTADLITFTKLREQAGYTNEELMGIQKLSLVNNKTLEANTKEILGAAAAYNGKNKLALNEKQILKDVNSASSALKLSLGGSVTQLTNAAAKAREFGLSLEQTEKIAESLLNFESSIEAELSAELLTGRNLNLEQARLLALNGKTADAAAEIAKQVGTAANFGNMNVIQQEAIAKAAGMSRKELADSLIDKESLAKLGVKDAKSAQDAYNQLKARGMSEMEIQKRLGNEKLAQQYEQQSVQDRFNQTVEKLKDIFVSLAEPILQIVSPIADFAGWISSILADVRILYPLMGLMGGVMVSKIAFGAMQFGKSIIAAIPKMVTLVGLSSAKAVAEITAAEAMTLGLGTIGIIAGIAAAVSAMKSATSSATSIEDGVIGPDGGVMISKGKNSIQLDREDTFIGNKNGIVAGTNLFGGNQQQSTSTQDNSSLIAELRAIRNELNSRPVVVHSVVKTENNDVLATATNTSNRKTGYSIQ